MVSLQPGPGTNAVVKAPIFMVRMLDSESCEYFTHADNSRWGGGRRRQESDGWTSPPLRGMQHIKRPRKLEGRTIILCFEEKSLYDVDIKLHWPVAPAFTGYGCHICAIPVAGVASQSIFTAVGGQTTVWGKSPGRCRVTE
jgi:hypothetical protein